MTWKLKCKDHGTYLTDDADGIGWWTEFPQDALRFESRDVATGLRHAWCDLWPECNIVLVRMVPKHD